MSESDSAIKWRNPSEIMALHRLKKKKKALQARINASTSINCIQPTIQADISNVLASTKRKNPFITNSDNKRIKNDINFDPDESSDQTLFKLLHFSKESTSTNKENIESAAVSQIEEPISDIKVVGEKWLPIDWGLKTKVRFLSTKPLGWSQKLKINEEASGLTSYTRCLIENDNSLQLDTSKNAKFHQCCLYWQHPSLPWLNLFPRTNTKLTSQYNLTPNMKDSLQIAWVDSIRSVFQLIRTRQCPFFYVCANTFTGLFRAAGVCGFNEIHALVTPTTRGFRNLLRQEEIEFTMPLKKKLVLDSDKVEENHEEEEEETTDEQWLESMGINSDDIKQINYTQDRITRKVESEVDNSEESIILIEGPEVQAFYSFLIHCKSIIATTGSFAGIPPTLLAPNAFNGATLTNLKVRENKVHVDNEDYYSVDLTGPILPQTVHNLCALHSKEFSMTATFSNLGTTSAFSRVKLNKKESDNQEESGTVVFCKENLSDCGLHPEILKHFCSNRSEVVSNVECLKYTAETNSYAWT